MTNDIPMLNEIYKATEMGCLGIQTVMDETADRRFRGALRQQLAEYRALSEEAEQLLREHGASAKGIPLAARVGSTVSAKMRVRAAADPTSKIAELMLQGNTRGMIKSMHNLRTMGMLEPKVSSLSNRLLQTEQANIDQMKQYL